MTGTSNIIHQTRGNMMGMTGPLVGRILQRMEDKIGRWCGFVSLGKVNKEILALTAYNIPQETPHGDDILHVQQTSLYLLDKVENPNTRKLFTQDLLALIEDAIQADQDIILMGDFSETISEDPRMMAQVLTAGRLINVYANRHGNTTNIATHIWG